MSGALRSKIGHYCRIPLGMNTIFSTPAWLGVKKFLKSDTSNFGLGAVIMQKESNGQVKAITQASKTVPSTEKLHD